jgi:hypothetical protein
MLHIKTLKYTSVSFTKWVKVMNLQIVPHVITSKNIDNKTIV